MSSENSPPPSPGISRRRSSFSPGQAFSGLFASRTSNAGQSPPPTAAYPGSIATAAANAQQRRSMSITTLGLSSSPTQSSSFSKPFQRRGSISSSGSGSPQIDEEAVEDGDAGPPNNTPATPFGRRLSFGAQALREVRVGSGSTNGRRSVSSTSTSPPAVAASTGQSANPPNPPKSPPAHKKSNVSWQPLGEGLNWGEQLRARARAPSISATSASAPTSPPNTQPQPLPQVQRPPGVEVKEPPRRKGPDALGERMLKGDFYMD